MRKLSYFTIAILVVAGIAASLAPQTTNMGRTYTASQNVRYANEGATGTTLNRLAKLTGAPSTAIIVATTDTSGIVGIVVAGAGTTGSADIAFKGKASCVFDSATTAGHYVVNDTSTAGDCMDSGSATYPATGQVIGVVTSTNGGAGTYEVDLTLQQPWVGAAPPSITVEDKDGGTAASAKTEYLSVAGGATATLVNYSGGSPGYVSSVFMGLGYTDSASATASTLSVTLDGAGSPTFTIRLPLYFGAEYLYNTVNFSNRWIGGQQNNSNNVGYRSFIPIPFNTGIKIEVTNGSAGSAMTLWTAVQYHTGVPNTWTRTRRLRVASGTTTGITVDTVVSLVDVSAIPRGRLMGVYMSIDSYPGSANPPAAPLEGNVKIYVDGGGSPGVEYPGTEDYFLWSNYFEPDSLSNVSADQGYMGLQFKSAIVTQTWNAYRFHIMDPIFFTNALKVTWNCGDSTQVNFTGGARLAWTVWYYTE